MASRIARFDLRLHRGVAVLGEAVLEPIQRAVMTCQQPDGGFSGRTGGSDVWYGDFAYRTLALCQRSDDTASRLAEWLSRQPEPSTLSALFNHLNLRRLLSMQTGAALINDDLLDRQHLPDGGWAHADGGGLSSYQTLLAGACCDLSGRRLAKRDALPLLALQRGDGGFAERADSDNSQTNATAAALAALALAGALDRRTRDQGVAFLVAQQTGDGGLRAHPALDTGDLLSSFSAAWTLVAIHRFDRMRLGDLTRFVAGLRLPTGGFASAMGDDATDTEYCYYGLALLALLRSHANQQTGWWQRLWSR
jgi:geranylgeranyl transferase type-2 subunit beta